MRAGRRTSACNGFAFLLLALSGPGACGDMIQDAVDQISLDQYQTYQIAIQDMGLGLYGGPDYNQGCRNRYGWALGGTLGNQEARLYIADRLWYMGLHVSIQGTFTNVVADWPGIETPEEIYILCAHYDTTADGERPGGDDNASGVAGVLEAARALTQYRFKSTLRFITFNAEEDWPTGSQEYVRDLPPGTHIAGVLNLDMILRPGWDSDPRAPINLEVETENVPACAAWMEMFVGAAATYVPDLVIDPNTHFPALRDYGDEGAFLYAGYAACTAVENSADAMWNKGSNLYYHTAEDASDRLANDPNSPSGVTYNYPFAVNVVKAAVATLATAAVLVAPDDPAHPGWQGDPGETIFRMSMPWGQHAGDRTWVTVLPAQTTHKTEPSLHYPAGVRQEVSRARSLHHSIIHR